jgi:hypothetical protein
MRTIAGLLLVLLPSVVPAHARGWKARAAFEHCGLAVPNDPAGVVATTDGKTTLIRCAVEGLFYWGVLADMPPVSYDPTFGACSQYSNGKRPDGCYVDRFMSTGNRRFDFVLGHTLCSREVFVTRELFQRGYSDFDPAGNTLWAVSWKAVAGTDASIYYSKATDLVEAIQFNLLHEYGHYLGYWEEHDANAFARDAIIALRSTQYYAALGMILAPFSSTLPRARACQPPPRDNSACMMSGSPPPDDDLPPGMR